MVREQIMNVQHIPRRCADVTPDTVTSKRYSYDLCLFCYVDPITAKKICAFHNKELTADVL